MATRKERIRQYKETPRTMGVYRVYNTVNGKMLIGAARDIRARLNRHRAELNWGKHRSPGLQADWHQQGPEAFRFETLDPLPPSEDPAYNPAKDLESLEALWTEKLRAEGVVLYSMS